MLKKLVISLIFVFCLLISEEGRAQTFECGLISSAAQAGVRFRFMSGRNDSELRLCADLYHVIDGKNNCPGGLASYFIRFNAAEWKINEEVRVQFNAGPGASAGYVMDNSDRRGVVAGMSGMASFDFRFNSGLSVSAGFSAVLGCHTGKKDGNTTLIFYHNGIYRAWIPEISINYRF